MNTKFIELHWYKQPALFNLDSVVLFQDKNFTDIRGHDYVIDESYDEIKELIIKAGGEIIQNDDREAE